MVASCDHYRCLFHTKRNRVGYTVTSYELRVTVTSSEFRVTVTSYELHTELRVTVTS